MIYQIQMITNFLGAVKRLLRRVFAEKTPVVVTEGEYHQRISICKACPYYKAPQCTVCLCFVAMKARLTTEKCPKNLWK